MDRDVAQLVLEDRLLEAARLASDRGDARTASAIYERACEWRGAAGEAMRAGEAPRALELALYGGDESTAAQALAVVVRDAATAESAAAQLTSRGQHAWAARVLEGCGRELDAARSWERAGNALRAAALLEGAGQAADAARVLQAGRLREPCAWAITAALGALLGRFGKWEAAVRVLQRVPPDAAERSEALVSLVHGFERLGFAHAAKDAAAELGLLERSATAPSKSRAADRSFSPDASFFGRYRLVRQIASSPSARVLECVDVSRGERVALKWFAASEARGSGRDVLARFEREVRAIGSLQHGSVVPLRDFIAEGPVLVLAWMTGGTLEQMLSSVEAIAPARAVEIASAVLSALGAAHRLGILHRDVKPANVLFDEGGGVRLSDFGVAHLCDVSSTVTAGAFGTMAYVSPEQRGGRPATAAGDVFAVGVMLREMLTCEKPSPDDPPRLLPSEAHRGLNTGHDAVVARMTAVDPRARPADAFEALSVLAALAWPRTSDAKGARRRAGPRSIPPAPAERLEVRPDGARWDRWTERKIESVSLTEDALARARAFAQADHPALQAVWRVDASAGAIWLEALDGRSLDRALTPEEGARLREALDALRAAGASHGRIDRQHVVIDAAGRVLLRFHADHEPNAAPDADEQALSNL